MHHHIPDEFPASSNLFSLGGLQQECSLSRDVDGKLRRPGDAMRGRLGRNTKYRCIVTWALGKTAKSKHAQISPGDLLAKFRVNLIRDFDLPTAEQDWVVREVARAFHSRGLET